MTDLPDLCAVVGGGQMGAGIAHALLLAGPAWYLAQNLRRFRD
jgi:3-hydroxyacyl-CoA dehydrogenase